MNNPDPFARAWRLESRRKQLGSDNPQCFYCSERDIACLQIDHPVTFDLDREFERVVCWNHHRKLEFQRDVAKLTKNGLRDVKESKRLQLQRYLRLLALDQESIAERVLSPDVPREVIAAALSSVAASLRRRADQV